MAQGAVNQAGDVVKTVVQAGCESAGSHGLAGGQSAGSLLDAALSGDLTGNAKQVAQRVLDAGEGAIRNKVEPKQDQTPAQKASPEAGCTGW
ncbi:hypothetical protein HN018_21835 (plasmid) [Lichenicola cladoniae]|uniref:Uncharacterized protein n=1 Tax=Lichenicola cladoniae TaxID=1484109 RepID=A0A6M8HWD7_9PROT|nr:hypothetical protein [Lichenicola cladoniae]NPD68974.1 hypothetical protein [Acetobacteraceae bacterium]QKE92873.1 hypothetical protein HN018_21835 [Lichenicola cladoniae]